jgi:hypothetical protein
MSDSRFALIASAVMMIALIQSACSNQRMEASAPGECRNFNEQHRSALRSKGDLAAARELRDLLLNCDVSKAHVEDAVRWAKIAADLGDAEDERAYQLLTDGAGAETKDSN